MALPFRKFESEDGNIEVALPSRLDLRRDEHIVEILSGLTARYLNQQATDSIFQAAAPAIPDSKRFEEILVEIKQSLNNLYCNIEDNHEEDLDEALRQRAFEEIQEIESYIKQASLFIAHDDKRKRVTLISLWVQAQQLKVKVRAKVC